MMSIFLNLNLSQTSVIAQSTDCDALGQDDRKYEHSMYLCPSESKLTV